MVGTSREQSVCGGVVTRPSEEEGVADHVRVTAAADALSSGGGWAPERRPSQLGCGSRLGSVRKKTG